ncbi:MAG TPA: 3-dehydroquinate synthase [Rubrobacteraceae bacterium]|nr:3-dehydroquinate synthase [Rubrobacteraceae bacterium]
MAVRIDVQVSAPYPVVIGPALDFAEALPENLESGVAAIVTDSVVGPLHASSVRQGLESAGWTVAAVIEVPAGERSKSLDVYARVVRELARAGVRRDGVLFVLGGGVVGDLGGFVAGSYMRGIPFVAMPTTLLAMVDSSVGGKVGLDLPEGKNLVGGFVRPHAVLADLDRLSTLPPREISNGLAEVIKMALLSGGVYLEDLRLIEAARAGDADALRTLVGHSVSFKADVVAEDEHETGRRAILNYGHTIGHGLEAAADYALPHGEAIAAGMVFAARLSRDRYGTDLVALHEDLLHRAGLPTRPPAFDTEKVLRAMGSDKKRRSADGAAEHRFVLLEDAGRPVWGVPVHEAEVRRVMGVRGNSDRRAQ